VAKNAVKEPFSVINADDFYGRSGYELLGRELAKAKPRTPDEYFMVGFELKNTLSEHGHVARGVCQTNSSGHLVEVVERTNIVKTSDGAKFTDEKGQEIWLKGDEIASMNMWGFTPSLFGYLEEQFIEFLKANTGNIKAEFFIPTVVSKLIKSCSAEVKVLPSKDQWFGVTYKEDKPVVVESIRKLIKSGVYPEKL